MEYHFSKGFTLVEVLVAGFASSIMVLALFSMFVQSLRLSSAIDTQISLNQDARLIMELLANGNASAGGGDGGYHGHAAPVDNIAYWTEDDDGQIAIGAAHSSRVEASIFCEGAGVPIPACSGNEELEFYGNVDSIFMDEGLVAVSDARGNARIVAVELLLMDPYRAASERNTKREYSETYSTIFQVHVDE